MPRTRPGLQQGVGVYAASHVVGQLAQLQVADAGGMLHHFEATEHIAFGVGQGLALFGGQHGGQFAHVFTDELLELEEDAGACADGGLLPGLEASLAEATAALISSAVANGTRASTCCVAGLTTSRHSVVLDSTNWPPISSLTVGALTAVDASMGFVS
jgi:hypothetical protein